MMKSLKSLALALVFCFAAAPAFANPAVNIMNTHLSASIAAEMDAMNLIDWKVGEHAEYSLTAMFGEIGKMNKHVDREEGNAIWVISEVTGMQSQKVEVLLDRASGQVLRYIENGQEKDPPSGEIEIIDQSEEQITVPAGTFNTIKIVAKTPQVEKLTLWANPRDIVMEGMAQMEIQAGFMPVTVKLLSFGE